MTKYQYYYDWILKPFFTQTSPWLSYSSYYSHYLPPTWTKLPSSSSPLLEQKSLLRKFTYGTRPEHAVPIYFEKFLQTNNIQDLLQDYSKFHHDALQKVKCNGQFSKQAPDWNQGAKFLVFKPWETSGLANVMIGLSSSFLVALLTERVFVIDWPGHWSCRAASKVLFQQPMFTWEMDTVIQQTQCVQLRSSETNHPDLNLEITHRTAESDFTNGFLKCSDFRSVMDYYGPIVEFTSNQYFAPILRDNSLYGPLLTRMYQSATEEGVENLFTPLVRYLFHPTNELQQKIDQWIEEKQLKQVLEDRKAKKPGRTKIIGLQIRRNEKEQQMQWFREKHDIEFFKCAKNYLLQHDETNFKVIVVSDNSTVKYNAMNFFGKEKVLYYEQPLTYERDESSVKNAVIDAWILSLAEGFVVSKYSTFGNVGHGLAGVIPNVMVQYSDTSVQCTLARNSEPDFHWWFNYKYITCSSWKGGQLGFPTKKSV